MHYKVYRLDDAGEVTSLSSFEADDDPGALAQAERLADGLPWELLQSGRVVATSDGP